MNTLKSNSHELIVYLLIALLLVSSVAFIYWFFKKKSMGGLNKKIGSVLEFGPDNFQRYQENAYKLLPEAVVILNSQNKIIYLNLVAEDMLSTKLRSVMGKPHSHLFRLSNSETGREMQGFFDTHNNLMNVQRECLLSSLTNKTYSIELNLLHNNSSKEHKKILIFKDITERKALESKLSNLETFDALTRMLNRKSFDAQVKQLIENAHKHNAKHLLAYFSIDQFQVVNDTIGYAGGENLIISMSEQIEKNTNDNVDIVGRVGANEFAVVFTDLALQSAIDSVKNILKSVSDSEFMSRGQKYSITLSVGFVVIDPKTTSSTRAISEANTACNLAGKRGGNNIVAYRQANQEMQKLEGNLEWVMILKKALQENRFRMHAQAIHPLNLEDYKKPFHHYECLIRLSDNRGNPISPGEFIGAAEYYSMMPRLDRWVVRNVLKHLSVIPEQNPLPMFAINLSGQSLNDPDFLNFVKAEIKSSGVHPQMLCFEITEQVAVEDLSSINAFIASLKLLGCKFSLDDFGTGISSYGYLRSLDVDYLKIDGSFVKHIANDNVAKTMVQSINQVGHTMNLKIIAEYVENDQIVKILRDMGVDYGQGYEIAKPIPIEDVIRTHKLGTVPV